MHKLHILSLFSHFNKQGIISLLQISHSNKAYLLIGFWGSSLLKNLWISLNDGSQYSFFSYIFFSLSINFPIPWTQNNNSFNFPLSISSSSFNNSPISTSSIFILFSFSLAGKFSSDASSSIKLFEYDSLLLFVDDLIDDFISGSDDINSSSSL